MTRFIFILCLLLSVAASPAMAQKKPAAAPVAATAAAAATTPSSAAADDVPPVTNALPDRIIRPMVAIDPVTLKAEGVEIRLWGIKSASTTETPLELKALDLLDNLIDGQVVNCKIEGGVMPVLSGRCVVQSSSDLSLELLNNGLAIRDRRQTYNTAYASAYGQAEELARLNKKGVWAFLSAEQKAMNNNGWMSSGNGGMIVPLALVLGPVSGLVVVAFVLWFWLQRMSKSQQSEAEQVRRKESLLQTRERNVLLTTLEGELTENKNKIEAFLVIYGDMLRSLKDTNEVPKYQQVGDIVQKHPPFSKTVFEANVNKLSLLGIKAAGQLSKLYSALPKEQEYINLDASVSLDTAVKLVEKILKEADDLLEPINSAIAALQVIAAQRPEA